LTKRWIVPVLVLAATVAALAQPGNEAVSLEARLPELEGLERARVLARLTEIYRAEAAEKAIAYGEEALEILAHTPDRAAEVTTRNELAWAYMVRGERQRAEALAREGRELARQIGDRRGEARAASNLGVIVGSGGDPLQAVELFTEALAAYRSIGARAEEAMSLNNLGVVHTFDLTDYELALEYHLEALAIRRRLGDRRDLALSFNNLGVIYQRLDRQEKAREHFTEALAIRRELGIQHRIAGTLSNLGDLEMDEGDLDAALEYHREALAIRQTIGEQSSIPMSRRNLAMIYCRLDRLEEAEEQAEEALAATEAMDAPREGSPSLLSLAEVRRRQGRLSEAAALARRALEQSEEISANDSVRRSARALAAIEEERGRFEEALAAHRRFKEVNDEIFDEERTRRVEILESRYQSERREREIAALRTTEALQNLELGRQRYQRNGVLAGAAVLAALGFGLYWRHRTLAHLYSELASANERLEELSITDALTGLHNRRYLTQSIEADLATSRRAHRRAVDQGEPPTGADWVFFLLDLDHFKSVNDEHGHAAGDAVLRQFADLLREVCRTADTLVRWGGEEFLVVSRSANRSESGVFAERLRREVAARRFDTGGGARIQRTCSIGFVAYPFVLTAPEALGWEQVTALADDALYAAKRSGRNAWVGLRSTESTPVEELKSRAGLDVEQWVAAGWLALDTSVS